MSNQGHTEFGYTITVLVSCIYNACVEKRSVLPPVVKKELESGGESGHAQRVNPKCVLIFVRPASSGDQWYMPQWT